MSNIIHVKPFNTSSSTFRKDLPMKSNPKAATAQKDTVIEIGHCILTHGLTNIFSSKHSVFKTFWLVITIVSAGLSIYFIRQTLIDYFTFKVMTEVRIIDADKGIEFPVIEFSFLE